MPLYDYFCQACGKAEEKLVRFEGRDMVSCPFCGAKMTRKLSTYHIRMFPIKAVRVNGEEVR